MASVCGGCAAGTAHGADTTVTTRAVTTYQNPVYGGLPDPMILSAGGESYAYGTGERFPMARSTDLVHWIATAPAMAARPAWVPRTGNWNPWAPSVLRRDGPCPGTSSSECFVMYYTGLNTTLEPDVNCIGVAVSVSPAGPFTDTGILNTDPPSVDSAGRPMGCGDDAGHSNIDAAPFVDPASGHAYLYLSTGHEPSTAWRRTISVIPLTADRLHAASPRVPLFSFTQPWEGDVVEGPWMVRRGESFFLFYSGGTFTNASYGLGYAYAPSPTGPFIKDAQLLGTVPLVVGPGGASLVTGPHGGDWAVYHGRAVPDAARTMRIDPLVWDDHATPSKVTVRGPSTRPEQRP
jgi:beta-xylosidase